MKKLTNVPNGALRLVDTGSDGACMFADGDKKKMRMVAYSGGIIKGHWYWDDLAIDVSGVKFDRKKYPVLEQHDISKKIAFSGKLLKDDNKLELNPNTTQFVDTPFSEEFQKLSEQGFPYQASIYAIPTRIERLEEDTKVEVNGFTMKGPGTIWRECVFQEASVCVFGWDKKTESKAFSKTEKTELEIEELSSLSVDEDVNANTLTGTKEVKSMDLETFKKDHPEVAKLFSTEVRVEVKTELEKGFEKERGSFTTKIDTLTTRIDEQDKKIVTFEKTEAIRTENELQAKADRIWDVALAKSELRESLYPKVRKHVSYSDHVDEKNVFDQEKFAEAVAAEITDWESRTKVDEVVLGVGGGTKDPAGAEGANKEEMAADQERTNDLLKLAGQKVSEK